MENTFSGEIIMNVIDHYDLLIEEQNDPFRNPPALQEYISKCISWCKQKIIF